MKTIVQSEAADSGLASLAMVAKAHGRPVGLPELRRRFPGCANGATLAGLVDASRQLGLHARPRQPGAALASVDLPCILQGERGHFAVLQQLRGNRATVLDPVAGTRRMSRSELSGCFGGAALVLEPAAMLASPETGALISLRRLAGPVPGLRTVLAQVLVLSLALQVFVLLAPLLMQWVVDQVLVAADRDLLAVLALGFGLALVLQVGIDAVRSVAVVRLCTRLGEQWSGNVLAHLSRLPLAFFERHGPAGVVARLASLRQIQRTAASGALEGLVDGLLVVPLLGLMLLYSPGLAGVAVLAVVLYASVRLLAAKSQHMHRERQWVADSRQQAYLLETLQGMQGVKVAGAESRRRDGHDLLRWEAAQYEARLAHFDVAFRGTRQLLFGLARIASIWIAAARVLDGALTAGMLIAVLAYGELFMARMSALVDQWLALRVLRFHRERLAGVVSAMPEPDLPGPVAVPEDSRIEVEDLCFRYADDAPWVLEGCSFSIAAGESVAITGASGCGKTTLVKLMLGVLTPTRGSIRIGGHALQALGRHELRRIIGAVMQGDQLFSGSIADNISFFDPDADPARIEVAASLAAVHAEIIARPTGYHGQVGDRGNALSAGQQQRILLARALYRQPRLLFLDEATSHLDPCGEQQVNAAVCQLRLTRLVVAHRPGAVVGADRVLRLEAGRLSREPPQVATAGDGRAGETPAGGPAPGWHW
ncbi:peptidase domain-containing ABC transporter [Stenotrophomonas sp. LARHCG68]